MFGDGDAQRNTRVKELWTAEPGLRWCRRQAAIMNGAADERLEKQPMRNGEREGNIGIGEAGPAFEVDSTPKLKPRQKESPIARHSQIQPRRQNGPIKVEGVFLRGADAVIKWTEPRFKSVTRTEHRSRLVERTGWDSSACKRREVSTHPRQSCGHVSDATGHCG